MKKIILVFIMFLFSSNVYASVVVVDQDTNRILYGKEEQEVRLIASTTKIMTAMVVINNTDIKEVIKCDENILRSYGSGIYIEIGEEISIEDLLYGLLLRSGNDAAIALATHVGGSEEGFAILMNELAASLGMTNTKFVNASGLDDELGNGNTSTAYDLAKLMSYAMQNETFRTITSTKRKVVKTNYKTYDWYNKNKLLSTYEYTTGGKTGYTKKAYRTLVTSATKDNKNLVVVTLNQKDDFLIHKSLYEEYFKKYKLVNIIDSKTYLHEEGMYVEKDFNMLLSDDEINKVKVEVKYTNDAIDRIGYVTVSLDGNTYFEENIYMIEEKDDKLTFIDKIKRFFINLFT